MKHIILLLCVNYILAAVKSPKVIIVGSGAAGLAAASKLVQNGFDIQILEAEDRIGGRLHSKKLGDYEVDLGAQWAHGEADVSYELAWPLGLMDEVTDWYQNFKWRFFSSSGDSLPAKMEEGLMKCFIETTGSRSETVIDSLDEPSLENYLQWVCEQEFAKHPEMTPELKKALLSAMNQVEMAMEPADSLQDVPAKVEHLTTGGTGFNWKNRTYTILIDVLLKKYPNPEEELPVEEKTMKNTKVTKIDYKNSPVKVTTADGIKHEADHVIFTPSLGVLKAKHEEMFDPALPPAKVNAIKHFGFGRAAKSLLFYDNPWWDARRDSTKILYWNEDDRKELEDDPERRWMLSVIYFFAIEHKPKLLFAWLDGKYVADMEKVPEARFKTGMVQLINRFFGKTHNLTEPKEIIRTMWNTNDNFLGAYSYQSMDGVKNNAKTEDIAEPILQNGKPVVQFAGEATSKYYSSVHGAILSGWREADRLIDFCKRNKSS